MNLNSVQLREKLAHCTSAAEYDEVKALLEAAEKAEILAAAQQLRSAAEEAEARRVSKIAERKAKIDQIDEINEKTLPVQQAEIVASVEQFVDCIFAAQKTALQLKALTDEVNQMGESLGLPAPRLSWQDRVTFARTSLLDDKRRIAEHLANVLLDFRFECEKMTRDGKTAPSIAPEMLNYPTVAAYLGRQSKNTK